MSSNKKQIESKKVLVCGIDGYIGWSLAMHLANRGHKVFGIDNLSRRKSVGEVGSQSITPILDMDKRLLEFNNKFSDDKNTISYSKMDLIDYDYVRSVFKDFEPDSIVHLAEQPSAPYSMIDAKHAAYTQNNNVIGTLNILHAMKEYTPNAHLVKLGTMGEYGTPNIEISENPIEIEYKGRKETIQFPKNAGSFYHWSKVHDTNNVIFACKIWNTRATDIMQGVVYGTRTDDMVNDNLLTRVDFDEYFGTVIHRFCTQALVGHDLTVYGKGGQTRGYLALIDSVQCLTLAIENPASRGEYRLFNQIDKTYSVVQLANIVKSVGRKLGLNVEWKSIDNPRVEKEEHFYSVEANKLKKLGFKPTRSIQEEVEIIFNDMNKFKSRIDEKKSVIMPKTTWVGNKLQTPSISQ